MTLAGSCFRCGRPGHFAAVCDELRPPGSRAEHERRLKEYHERFQRWLDGSPGIKWDPETKKQAIEAENRMREKEKAK